MVLLLVLLISIPPPPPPPPPHISVLRYAFILLSFFLLKDADENGFASAFL